MLASWAVDTGNTRKATLVSLISRTPEPQTSYSRVISGSNARMVSTTHTGRPGDDFKLLSLKVNIMLS